MFYGYRDTILYSGWLSVDYDAAACGLFYVRYITSLKKMFKVIFKSISITGMANYKAGCTYIIFPSMISRMS